MSNPTMESVTTDEIATKPLAVVLLADSFLLQGVEALKSLDCEVELDPSLKEEALVEAIERIDPDILVVRSTIVTAQMINASERLSVIIRAGAGYDTIDVSSASSRGVYVANCPGKNAVAVAELTWSLILACDRRIPDQVHDLKNEIWNKKEFAKARGLYGRTLGIVGLGGIGCEVASRARAFGMKVVAWSRSMTEERAVSLGVDRCENIHNLARMSNVVTIHLASTPQTEQFIDKSFLDAMQDGAIFINTSRGNIVDESALVQAVQTKHLRVGLDVYMNEPASSDDTFSPEILKQVCVYGTHHVGASTEQAQSAIAMEAVRIISAYISDGTVPNCVNRAKSTPAKALLSVRHRNLPGVLAHVFESISHAGVNVEEMENIIYEGAKAACARIQLDDLLTSDQLATIRDNENILSVTVSIINNPQ